MRTRIRWSLKKLVDSSEDMLFFADANGIFDKLGLDALKKFDQVGLALIEQPFGDDEWDMHRKAVQSHGDADSA